MKVLLDTHTFLWFIGGDSKLDNHARHLIEIPDNERFLSIASVWEITIKASLGRLAAPMPPNILVRDHVWANGVLLLPISTEHLDTLHNLPYHHKDPFDRLIVAQAIHEKMVLVTRDQALSDYGVKVAWSSSTA